MIKVRIWQDSYYPCGYQLQAISDKITDMIMSHCKTESPSRIDDKSAVCDEIPAFIPQRRLHELSRGWPIVVLVDAWEFAHYYGYDAHTLFETN